jgi:hypothetical protein
MKVTRIPTNVFLRSYIFVARKGRGGLEVERWIGEELSWERLDQRRASRIAAYRPGAITDESDVLLELRGWAVGSMIKFYKVLRPMILQVKPTL